MFVPWIQLTPPQWSLKDVKLHLKAEMASDVPVPQSTSFSPPISIPGFTSLIPQADTPAIITSLLSVLGFAKVEPPHTPFATTHGSACIS